MGARSVMDYYAQYDEWGRLESPAGRLEFDRCMHVLNDGLDAHSRVLDLGGGPGRYTVALTRRGHRVTLVDLSDKHVRRARRELLEHDLLDRVEGLHQGNARDLSMLADGSFDAVVAFGPFYHLVEADGRAAAAAEIARVVRDGGRVFVQFLPPASGFVRLIERAADHPDQIDARSIEVALDEHVFHNPSDQGFQEGYYAEIDEVRALFEARGIAELDALSIRGVAAGQEDKLLRLRDVQPALYEKCYELLERTARRPDVIAMGQIAVWVGCKQARH